MLHYQPAPPQTFSSAGRIVLPLYHSPGMRSDTKCNGPSRSTISAPLRDEQRRRDPKRRADHAADHDPQAPPLRNRGQRERLGQPARLVQLDIDRRVFPVEPVEIGTRPAGFVGADRDRMLQPRQRVISVGRQRCSSFTLMTAPA